MKNIKRTAGASAAFVLGLGLATGVAFGSGGGGSSGMTPLACTGLLANGNPSNNNGAGSTTCTTNQIVPSQPFSTADNNNTGANTNSTDNPYVSNNLGQTQGGHAAGSVGAADNKFPSGQVPNGTDSNRGYECDQNPGIGNGNPAHTACSTPPLAPTSTTTSTTSTTMRTTPTTVAGAQVSGVTVTKTTTGAQVAGVQVTRTLPTTSAAPSAAPTAKLAFTGSNAGELALLGLGLIGAGTAAAVVTRRRRPAVRQ